MTDNTPSKLKALALEVEAELIRATVDFSDNPSMKTLNRLRQARENKKVFASVTEKEKLPQQSEQQTK